MDGYDHRLFSLLFGINAFYLAHTVVEGDVTQEQLFTNLSYSYSITNYPIYIATKALIKSNSDKYNITFDLGIGPNIIKTQDFDEHSLDGGITIPDHIFSGETSTVFSATAGIGIKFNHVLGHLPLEIGYRFFYLGEGSLNKDNSQVIDNLKTGDSYANSLVISTSI